MLQPELQRHDRLTKRQREVLERLEQGFGAKQIATDLGVTRNAVYQHIERLRRQGALAETYTPSGQPPRSPSVVGNVALAPAAVAPRDSVLPRLRELAAAGASAEAADYASAIESAIATGDAVALATSSAASTLVAIRVSRSISSRRPCADFPCSRPVKRVPISP